MLTSLTTTTRKAGVNLLSCVLAQPGLVDSLVPEEANYDLMVAINQVTTSSSGVLSKLLLQIQSGTRKEPSLFVKAEKKSKTTEVKK